MEAVVDRPETQAAPLTNEQRRKEIIREVRHLVPEAMQHPVVRRLLWLHLQTLRDQPLLSNDPRFDLFTGGKRSAIDSFRQVVDDTCPELWAEMMKENQARG